MATRPRGSIIPLGGDKFMVRLFFGKRPDGKRESMARVIIGNKNAKRTLTAFNRERDQGTLVRPTRETLGGYLERWLKDVAVLRTRPQSVERYRKDLQRYVIPRLGSRRLSELRHSEIQSLYADLSGRGLSPATIRGVHAPLRRALNVAVRTGELARNPAQLVELPRLRRNEMCALSPEAVTQFLAAATGDQHEVLFRFLLATGCRPGEAIGLRWQDLQNGSVMITHALVRERRGWRLDEPKTSKSVRRIPLDAGTLRLLESHRRRQNEERMKAGPAYRNHGFVFATSVGEPLNLRNVAQRHLKPILKAAELPTSFRLYDFRHTCATLMLTQREPVKVVSERLGHASATLTTDVYQHVVEGIQEAASERLGLLLDREA